MKTGDIVEGEVSYIGHNSLTVKVGNYAGLLLSRDYDWLDSLYKMSHTKIGDRVKAVVVKVFENSKQMNLNARELKPDPFIMSADKIVEEGYMITHIFPKRERSLLANLNGTNITLKLESGISIGVSLKDSLIPEDELIEGKEYLFYASKIDYQQRIIKLQLVGKIG